MTIHQCPKCELRFDWKTELEDHCWHDHPQFRHDYPVGAVPHPVADQAPPAPRTEPAPGTPALRHKGDGFVRRLVPRGRGEQQRVQHRQSEPGTEQRDA